MDGTALSITFYVAILIVPNEDHIAFSTMQRPLNLACQTDIWDMCLSVLVASVGTCINFESMHWYTRQLADNHFRRIMF